MSITKSNNCLNTKNKVVIAVLEMIINIKSSIATFESFQDNNIMNNNIIITIIKMKDNNNLIELMKLNINMDIINLNSNHNHLIITIALIKFGKDNMLIKQVITIHTHPVKDIHYLMIHIP